MRKFIALGISTIAIGSMFLTAAGPATAAASVTTTTVPPLTIVDTVCDSVPAAVSAVDDAIGAIDLDAVMANYVAKKATAQTATTAFVDSLVQYLLDTASGSLNLPISTSTLTVRSIAYSAAVADWSAAAATVSNSYGMSELLGVNASSLTQLADGLGCVPPVVPSV